MSGESAIHHSVRECHRWSFKYHNCHWPYQNASLGVLLDPTAKQIQHGNLPTGQSIQSASAVSPS